MVLADIYRLQTLDEYQDLLNSNQYDVIATYGLIYIACAIVSHSVIRSIFYKKRLKASLAQIQKSQKKKETIKTRKIGLVA